MGTGKKVIFVKKKGWDKGKLVGKCVSLQEKRKVIEYSRMER